jgi:hypothetical protein
MIRAYGDERVIVDSFDSMVRAGLQIPDFVD